MSIHTKEKIKLTFITITFILVVLVSLNIIFSSIHNSLKNPKNSQINILKN